MALDARGRAATTELRRATTQRVDPMIMLNELERSSRAKSRKNVVAAVAAAAALIVGGLFVAHAVGGMTEAPPQEAGRARLPPQAAPVRRRSAVSARTDTGSR